jgi:hypothetical protein
MLRPADVWRRALVPAVICAALGCLAAAGCLAIGGIPGAARGTGAGTAPAHTAGAPASAVDPNTFDPGELISDENFYDAGSMTAGDVQRFLDAQKCSPADDSPCLKDYRVDTTTQPTQFAHCDRYPGGRKQRASTIIAGVARACGVSPKVLLVLLQKEQSLITHPSDYGYRRATGYACPDTSGCDARYLGFFNQVYDAAWQFREYSASPGWRYRIGAVRVPYSPDASCGSSVVRIRNQATANLYNYTPYQPDQATLKHPDGPGSRCSTFGNLNFSRIYAKWFGSPSAERIPAWWGACLTYPGGNDCATPREIFPLSNATP